MLRNVKVYASMNNPCKTLYDCYEMSLIFDDFMLTNANIIP